MFTTVEIIEPIYTHNEKKYMDIKILYHKDIDIVNRLSQTNSKSGKFSNSLKNGNILKVKIPYRYRKIECRVEGLKTLYEYKKNDMAMVEILYMGEWVVGDFAGNTWKLMGISPGI